jgi:hypothetical protein
MRIMMTRATVVWGGGQISCHRRLGIAHKELQWKQLWTLFVRRHRRQELRERRPESEQGKSISDVTEQPRSPEGTAENVPGCNPGCTPPARNCLGAVLYSANLDSSDSQPSLTGLFRYV